MQVSVLTVLKELKDPHSRFKPYVDSWPKPGEVVHTCNFDPKYAPMFKSPHWEQQVRDWETHLQRLLSGDMDDSVEYTIREMVGNATVTLDDLKYACGIAFTRAVMSATRNRMLLVPVFDMANHKLECRHYLSEYQDGLMYFLAGEDIAEGQEICYGYGAMRDDYAVAHYGFLPELEDPPRLALVDHRGFNAESPYSHDEAPSEEAFTGTAEEMDAELKRLVAIYEGLMRTPNPLPTKPPGEDYMYDTMKGLESRRINALQYEMQRLAGLLQVNLDLS
ncbi:hypothetical protein GPECTOR_2g1425 [Gonium pectorale]|uniref:SET domain-containing protein n=1 Tax=Gonium pectorale TaxID=33097 RepID=A0A150H1E8_GONPE|nr:hypothetical protein GPECTOR_2g1425 [Gonium pectorale]|eukprot:KXZ55874.1 hypothetical protein GPECTOR_2g1425 [Gonium pectorale]